MKAWIDNQKGVGYVVCWLENRISRPLRNFGQLQSAAMEFRNWLNNCLDERLQGWVKQYAESYKPENKYTYPIFNNANNHYRPTLRRQRDEQL